jgi:hypothetical protein
VYSRAVLSNTTTPRDRKRVNKNMTGHEDIAKQLVSPFADENSPVVGDPRVHEQLAMQVEAPIYLIL